MHAQPISLLSFLFLLACDASAAPIVKAHSAEPRNANHVFNAIHSSMRQWGSSLNHNGMSFFMATVPAGTQLYHGTSSKEVVKGMEWLAFEPEHALVFARPRGPPGGGRPGHGPGDGEDDRKERIELRHPRDHEWEEHDHRRPDPWSRQGHAHTPPPPDMMHGPGRRPSPYADGPPSEEPFFPPPPPPSRQGHAHTSPPPDMMHRPEHRPFPDAHGPPDSEEPFFPPPPPPSGHEHTPYGPDMHGPDHGPFRHPNGRPDGAFPPPPPPPPPPGHEHLPHPPPMHGPGHVPSRYADGPPSDDSDFPPSPYHNGPHDNNEQPPSSEEPTPPPNAPSGPGYLHTYVPTRALRLLYVDGLSAGKTSNGTLDSQDRLLLTKKSPPSDSPMGGEIARAKGLCELAATTWKNKIDGILRMEAGFEIILCDFESTVTRKNIVTYDAATDERPGGPPSGGSPGKGKGPGGVMGGWRYIKAVSERFHGIGGGRVTLDYENFVSVFAFDGEGEETDMGLWDNDVVSDTPHPRLVNASPKQLETVRDAVTKMILESNGEKIGEGRDWQATADMVIQRYSDAIRHLHTDSSVRRSKEAFSSYLSSLLRPFVSPSARNTTLETERCVAQVIPPFPLPPSGSPSLAHTTLHTVTTHICSTLLNALDASSLTLSRSLAATSSPPYHALDLIDALVGYLQWTSWKECGPCSEDKVCFVPMWPMGSLKNHKNPQCVSEEGVGQGYWGHMGPPRGGRGGKGPGGDRDRPPPPGEEEDADRSERPGRGGRHSTVVFGLGNSEGSHGPGRFPPMYEHERERHGWGIEEEGRRREHGERPKHGGAPPRHGARPPPPHHDDRHHHHQEHDIHRRPHGGGWDRGVWHRLRGSFMHVLEWFGPGPVPGPGPRHASPHAPHHDDDVLVDVNFV